MHSATLRKDQREQSEKRTERTGENGEKDRERRTERTVGEENRESSWRGEQREQLERRTERTVGEENRENSWRGEQREQSERTMALIRVKYIDPDNEELFGVDQDVPQNLVKRTGKTTDDGLQEGVLHWPKKGGSGKGKKMKSKSPQKYRVAILDSPPPASKALLTGHGRGRYDKPGM